MAFPIEMHEPSKEFARCWQAAGRHLGKCGQEAKIGWLKVDLIPPFLEHLSFRLGNQLFFIRIEDVEDDLVTPGNPDGIRHIAESCKGHGCLMPMLKIDGLWSPTEPGWGLIDHITAKSVDPWLLVNDERIELTDWEVHDFAVQVVRNHVTNNLGYKLMSSQGNPQVNPSLWFVGEDGPEWVVVRAVRYPEKSAEIPSDIEDITAYCAREAPQDWHSEVGHFASVSVASAADSFRHLMPLLRGHPLTVQFDGLQAL